MSAKVCVESDLKERLVRQAAILYHMTAVRLVESQYKLLEFQAGETDADES